MITTREKLEQRYDEYMYIDTKFVKGMEFLMYETPESETVYFVRYVTEEIDPTEFSEVYSDGNLTKGRKKRDDTEVIIDDDGYHSA